MHGLHVQAVSALEVLHLFTCYLRRASNSWLGVRKPVVQREHSQTGPEAIGSFFFNYRPATIEVNKSSELRTDLKTVEPSYTSAPHQLKSRITCKTCFMTIEYGVR